MRYKQIFTNEYVAITINTNTKILHDLIDNFMDFPIKPRKLKSKINVSLYLQSLSSKTRTDENRFDHSSIYKNNCVFSSIGSRLITTQTDLKTNSARTTFLGFDETMKELIIDFSIMQPLCLILGRHGFFHIHASMISKHNSCLLLSGDSGSGKSSLALTLAMNGFQLHSDDDCFIKCVKGRHYIFPFSTKIGLTQNILRQYPDITKHTLKDFQYGDKKRVSTSRIVNQSPNHSICKSIIYPVYKPEGPLSLHVLSRAKGLKRLINNCHSVYPENESKDMLWTFFGLSQNVAFFELIYNDRHLNKIPALINRSVEL